MRLPRRMTCTTSADLTSVQAKRIKATVGGMPPLPSPRAKERERGGGGGNNAGNDRPQKRKASRSDSAITESQGRCRDETRGEERRGRGRAIVGGFALSDNCNRATSSALIRHDELRGRSERFKVIQSRLIQGYTDRVIIIALFIQMSRRRVGVCTRERGSCVARAIIRRIMPADVVLRCARACVRTRSISTSSQYYSSRRWYPR